MRAPRTALTALFVVGLALSATVSASGPYAGLTQLQAKHDAAVDWTVERESQGKVTVKQSGDLIEQLNHSRATFLQTKCLVLPANVTTFIGTPKGLKLKPFWEVTFPSQHARMWESEAKGLAGCTRSPTNTAIYADSFPH